MMWPWRKSDYARSINFSFVLPRKLAGLAMPDSARQPREAIRFLRDKGVTHLVNLTAQDYASPSFRDCFKVMDCPIAEFDVPTAEQFDAIVDLYQSPAIIAVHCMAGVGRTGLVLSCLVGLEFGLSGYPAISYVRRSRPGSVESGRQAAFVCEFLDGYKRAKIAT